MTLRKSDQDTITESSKQKNGNILSRRLDINRNGKRSVSSQKKEKLLNDPNIYYQGQNIKLDLSRRIHNLKPSNGINKKDTSYHVIPGDHILHRYETYRSIGQGSFGNVVECFDHKDQVLRAVKVVRRDIRFTTQAQEEIAILERLKTFNPEGRVPSNRYPIIYLLEHFMFREHMCLVFELLGCSLYDLIKEKKNQGIPRNRARRLMLSVLEGLSYVRKAGIIHCDLKPENVLLLRSNEDPETETRDLVKIIDFGSSCLLNKQCYPYIQSRFYRAPEVILRVDYSQPIDIWSFGCLIFEMIRGNPLFPGEDEFDQMACMMEKLGMPPEQMVRKSRVYSRYFYDPDPGSRVYTSKGNGPLNIVPRYCSVNVSQDKNIELRPNFSKRGRRLRKPPGAVSLMQALTSTISSISGKYDEHKPSKPEEIDNMHVVTLMEACLAWQPYERTNPDDAKLFSWFHYPSMPVENRNSKLLIDKMRSNEPVKQTPLRTVQQLPNITDFASAVVTKKSPSSPLIQEKPILSNIFVGSTLPDTIDHADTAQKNLALICDEKEKSRTKTTGSPASISSGENKQQERVIYARPHKNQKQTSYGNERKLSQRKSSSTSDISIRSNTSSINEDKDHKHYSRKVVRVSEKCQDTKKIRKRNQSAEPKRLAQSLRSSEVIEGNVHTQGTGNHPVTCKTATMASPEVGSDMSGRNPPINMAPTTMPDKTSSRNRKHSSPERLNVLPHAPRLQRHSQTERLTTSHYNNRPPRRYATTRVLSFENLNSSAEMEVTEPKQIFVSEIAYQPAEILQGDQPLKPRTTKSATKTIAPHVHSDSRRRTVKVYNLSASTPILNNAITQNDSLENQKNVSKSKCIRMTSIDKNLDENILNTTFPPYTQGANQIPVKPTHHPVMH